MNHSAMALATIAAATQMASQYGVNCGIDSTPTAASAVRPIAIQPFPGTVVNVSAASIVLRMYRRFSRAPESIGVGSIRWGRLGEALIGVFGRVSLILRQVLYAAKWVGVRELVPMLTYVENGWLARLARRRTG